MPEPTLLTIDGVHLTGRRWKTAEPAAATVVIVHGFSASSQCPNVAGVAEALHEDGFDVLTYDARGHGTSGGESTLGDHEEHDVAAAVALARERTPDVILVGASMGAIAALRYAATDADLAGVVTVSCPSQWRLPRNVRGLLAVVMTRTGAGRRLTSRLVGVRVANRWTNPEPPMALVPRVTAPFAVVHGTEDHFIPVRDAFELHEAATSPSRIDIIAGLGHAFEPLSIEAVRQSVAWVRDRHAAALPV
ncbi:MAG: phospholipase/Carboxylesterase family protein [Actinomycetia bacterium]|jgi:alpha-beta hydrolase superfamily lysophospholipase|nr:phospholipase/Carboxylesterase family protein [Actinomycetes bacterium]